MAEDLGPKFGHSQDGGMTFLNREIVDRLKKARDVIFNTDNTCSAADVHDLRIIVRETISYMTAVLIQKLIDSMVIGERLSRIIVVFLFCLPQLFVPLSLEYDTVEEKQQAVELMAFATLPRIKTCGHEVEYETLHADLVTDKFDDDMFVVIMTTLERHYNCLGLTCDDIGRHAEDGICPGK